MKKYIVGAIIFLSSISSNGQVSIGSNLDKIKEEDSTGTLKIDPNGKGFIYVYDNKKIETMFFYFLNINKVCYATSIKPYTKTSKKYWSDGLKENKDWVKVKSKSWFMDLENGVIVECNEEKDYNKELIYIFIAKLK